MCVGINLGAQQLEFSARKKLNSGKPIKKMGVFILDCLLFVPLCFVCLLMGAIAWLMLKEYET